jgi:hypothetical protein
MNDDAAPVGSWPWALEQMKAGKRVIGGDFAAPIHLTVNGTFKVGMERCDFELCDFDATNWQIVEETE